MVPAVAAQIEAPNPEAPPETAELSFLIGTWELETSFNGQDGERVYSSAYMEAHYILNGFAVQMEQRHRGRTDFRSLDVYHFDTDREMWAGAAVNTLGNRKIMDGKKVGDTMVFIMGGELFGGVQGIRRMTYYDITEDSFSLRNDFSPDGGITWVLDTYSYTATRVD